MSSIHLSRSISNKGSQVNPAVLSLSKQDWLLAPRALSCSVVLSGRLSTDDLKACIVAITDYSSQNLPPMAGGQASWWNLAQSAGATFIPFDRFQTLATVFLDRGCPSVVQLTTQYPGWGSREMDLPWHPAQLRTPGTHCHTLAFPSEASWWTRATLAVSCATLREE